MAISLLCGFEMGTLAEATVGGSTAGASVQSTTTHGGGFALRINPSGTTRDITLQVTAAGGTAASFCQSMRFYFRVASLPSAITRIANGHATSGVGQVALMLSPTGVLSVGASSTTLWASSTNTLSADGLWHRIDWDAGYSSGNGSRVFVDGVLWLEDTTNATGVSASIAARIGVSFDSATADLYYDDLVVYDSALPATLNDYKLGLLLPAGDNAVGNWKRNDNVTTLTEWDAVNNVPPTGTAVSAVLAANYIQNGTAGSGVAADRIDWGTQAFTNLSGLTDASQVKAVMAIANGAQQVTTGSPKSGSMTTYSNPANASIRTFDYGLPNGLAGSTTAAAQGAFPTGWGTAYGPVLENPTVTVGSGAGLRVARTGTYTRVISLDFAGVYVLWEALVTTITPARLQGAQFAVQRAANY